MTTHWICMDCAHARILEHNEDAIVPHGIESCMDCKETRMVFKFTSFTPRHIPFDVDKHDVACMRCGSGFRYWERPTDGHEELLHCSPCYFYREDMFAKDSGLRTREEDFLNRSLQ